MTVRHTLQTDTYLPYMRDVARCEQSLRELDQMWRMIESSAKMNCPIEAQTILPTMAATRTGLNKLERDLVRSLVGEKVGNVLEALGTKAQYVIDIVVRNLFERTADVGFLATDDSLCAFVAGEQQDADAVRYRLQQYQAKYSVYDEIMLLDTEGNVLVQIDPTTPVEGSSDPMLAEALASDNWVETFRSTDLRPGKSRALVYARRMLHPKTQAPIGILCLCFDFENEMAGIFRSHRDPEGRSIQLLLDSHNRVIASADEEWIRPGAVVPTNPDARPQLMIHGGREYLVRTFGAQGYQGYPGPSGWQGQVMVPVELAFSGLGSDTLAQLNPELAAGLLSHARTFSPPLYQVISATEAIRRVVWNGQVITAGKSGELQKLKTILEQISETGVRSNELFSSSVRDLYSTVLESSLDDAEFASLLLVDLLDRNLYERANDCRWWALTPQLAEVLRDPSPSAQQVKSVTDILQYINRLYTVYTGIHVYNRNGQIMASSCPTTSAALTEGSGEYQIDASTLAAVMGLSSDQSYHASAFLKSPLYGDRPTYVYHAAIRSDAGEVLGGIAIVFDAEPELSAMLRGGLVGKTASHAFYVNRQGEIISTTDPTRSVGGSLDLPADVLALPNGQSIARIVEHDGHYAIMGCSVSQGYREFKTTDGYREDVIAVIFTLLGEVRRSNASGLSSETLHLEHALPPGATGGQEFATFFSGGNLLGLSAEFVVEALPATGLSARTLNDDQGRIGMLLPREGSSLNHFVWVFDLGVLLGHPPSPVDSRSQIIIVRQGYHTMGLLVDELHGVPEFASNRIIPSPFGGEGSRKLITQFIKAGENALVQLIDPNRLFARLTGSRLNLMAEAA